MSAIREPAVPPIRTGLHTAAAAAGLCSLAELETQVAEVPVFPTGWDALDARLEGGFPRGQLSECSAPPTSCGLTSLLHQLLLAARRQQQFVGLIDAGDCFDPGSCHPALLESLLWMRTPDVKQAMKAADIVLRDDNFGLILLDLRDASPRELRRVPAPQWYRLQHAAREHETTLLAFTPFPLAVAARRRLRLGPWQRPRPDLPLDDVPRAQWAEGMEGMRSSECEMRNKSRKRPKESFPALRTVG